ncbi:MAG TPA: TolC family protein, partial [Blastocatellia bacterium]|nr:TolC family protein [Blastocatellia bacterium]
MTNGKPRAARFRGARAIRMDAIILILCAFMIVAPALQRSISASPAQTAAALGLEDLERMALQNNPTVAQAEAAVRAAEGRRVQAGLMPNPIVGYAGEELST